ncbi:hypothetical protein BDM02DRAFT_3112040 [Thelephora ganbajun]|uniref:Uncharacterized protein n=1 Tax=Thelephora ganbajun TaxID=370292 RepID=A0ACB6ZLP3_THEGA|nr:hypothetical protein BDM02DRAFT_3112040 [Thelephora ganbajun]
MRVYALSARKRLVLWVFSVLIVVCVVMGLYMVFSPWTKAIQNIGVPLPAFRICSMDIPLWTEWIYVAGVSICELSTFACIVAFIRKLNASLGQEGALSHLTETLIQDSTVYFCTMLTFDAIVLVYVVMGEESLKNFPLVIPTILVPVMLSRLILSLRKAADEGLVLYWNEDHFSVDQSNSTNQEVMALSFRVDRTTRGVRTEGTIS